MKEKEKTKTTRTGLNLLEIVQVVFITLKLCNVITWSWWTVLIPLWISLGALMLLLIIAGIVSLLDD